MVDHPLPNFEDCNIPLLLFEVSLKSDPGIVLKYLDLHLISAENYFNLRNYANSLEQVRYINSIFFCDLTTQEGILTLETEINRLKLTL